MRDTTQRQFHQCLAPQKLQKHSHAISRRHNPRNHSMKTSEGSCRHLNLVPNLQCRLYKSDFLFPHNRPEPIHRFVRNDRPKQSKMNHTSNPKTVSHHVQCLAQIEPRKNVPGEH